MILVPRVKINLDVPKNPELNLLLQFLFNSLLREWNPRSSDERRSQVRMFFLPLFAVVTPIVVNNIAGSYQWSSLSPLFLRSLSLRPDVIGWDKSNDLSFSLDTDAFK